MALTVFTQDASGAVWRWGAGDVCVLNHFRNGKSMSGENIGSSSNLPRDKMGVRRLCHQTWVCGCNELDLQFFWNSEASPSGLLDAWIQVFAQNQSL